MSGALFSKKYEKLLNLEGFALGKGLDLNMEYIITPILKNMTTVLTQELESYLHPHEKKVPSHVALRKHIHSSR